MSGDGADRAIVGGGTTEAAWQAWPGLAAVPVRGIDELLPEGRRLIVVAPHPDDEVLACGGLLAMAAARGRELALVAVTDGDASHPGSTVWPPDRLARQRRVESRDGMAALGIDPDRQHRLALPDGAVAGHVATLRARLAELLTPRDVVVGTWRFDGHPDHEASAEATCGACADVGCVRIEAPVWMWHWAAPGDPRVPWSGLCRLPLTDDAARRKAEAIAAHRTQLEVQDTGAGAVLPPTALMRLLRADEYYFVDPAGAPGTNRRLAVS